MKRVKSQGIDIEHVAKLANLSLSYAQKKIFKKQLAEILSYINKLGEINTKKIKPIANITGLENVTRGDEPVPSIPQDEALSNAKRKHNGFFEVDAIFEETRPE